MTYDDGVSNGHVTDDVTWPQRCCEYEAVRSAILATAWLLVAAYATVLHPSVVVLVLCLW